MDSGKTRQYTKIYITLEKRKLNSKKKNDTKVQGKTKGRLYLVPPSSPAVVASHQSLVVVVLLGEVVVEDTV